jgi:hypothetical protein
MRSEDGGVRKRLLSAFADRLRAKAAIRRKRDLKRASENKKTHEEMLPVIGRGNLLTSVSFPSQDSGTLTAVMAVLCEWNGTTRKWEGTVRGEACPASYPRGRDSMA